MAKRCREADPRPRPRVEARHVTASAARMSGKATRDSDRDLLRRYDSLFGASRGAVLDVSAKVIDRATELRARYGFKSPDAIHLATALDCAVAEFWTGDAALSRCTDVPVTVLVPAAP